MGARVRLVRPCRRRLVSIQRNRPKQFHSIGRRNDVLWRLSRTSYVIRPASEEFSGKLGIPLWVKSGPLDPKCDFRFTPESRLRADIAPCPFRAKTGSRAADRAVEFW